MPSAAIATTAASSDQRVERSVTQLGPLRAHDVRQGDPAPAGGRGGDAVGGDGGAHAACSRSVVAPAVGDAGVVLDGVAGQRHERVLQRCLLGRQLVQDDRRAGRRSRRSAALSRPWTSSTPRSTLAMLTPVGGQRVAQRAACGVRTRTAAFVRGLRDDVGDAGVGDQPPAADDDQVLGGQRDLAHQVRGEEDRAALGGQALEQVADPEDALGVQAVGGLVEDHASSGSPSSAAGDAQALAHAEREAADALAGDARRGRRAR